MTMGPSYPPDGGQWRCGRCGCPLEQGKVQVFYLNSAFDVFLPRWPKAKCWKWKLCWKTSERPLGTG